MYVIRKPPRQGQINTDLILLWQLGEQRRESTLSFLCQESFLRLFHRFNIIEMTGDEPK